MDIMELVIPERMRAETERQAVAAARRYRATADERGAVERQQREGLPFPDSRQALATRVARLMDRQGVPAAAVIDSVRREPLDEPSVHERIIGLASELQAYSFLPRGTRAAQAVARISMRTAGREIPLGTGFLVSPALLLTNHHVLPDEDTARQCFVEFEAQATVDNTPGTATRLELDPDAFFTAHQPLDYALVMVAAMPGGGQPGEMFGWNRLSTRLGKVVIGEAVNIVGHPRGRLKEVALRDNAVQVRLDHFLHYRTDTEPGNSGSPVFNDQWEVVALHHSGVPRIDDQGRILRRDGRPWRRGDPDDTIDWLSNEGVRISSVLRHLATVPLDPARRALLADMGPEAGLQAGPAPAPPAPQPEPRTAGEPAGEAGEEHGPGPDTTAPAPAARARRGLRARPTAFGGRRHLVFLHGRGQQGREPERLRRSWTAGLNGGLTEAGLAPLDPADVWFPFYGDELVRSMAAREELRRMFEEVIEEPAEALLPARAATRGIYEEMFDEAARRTGMPEEAPPEAELLPGRAIGGIQQKLSWLAARTDVDEWVIARKFRDVAAYLGDDRVREDVLRSVLESMPEAGEVVLVSHSLGTVVGMDLVTRLAPSLDLILMVTAGSPLGMDAVHSRLLGGGPRRPERVARWVNVWSPPDPVAIGCPLAGDWQGELTELSVRNARDRAHDIKEYLGHPEVAAFPGRVLTR
ncbi:trypsin-like peptidase domain-containing protein [Streptomyces sp. YIM 98790]|uniref:trypsin-like peptidase domain-containing protein n=1 Tax=Streptomyces sp. YIM 98790 TaxID=2689077 RepID=UPI001FB83A30|nr:trypsin-like peptidase domain-containing protein [Streptomyces sp. YIM 98790]